MTVAITGASGQLGRSVTARLDPAAVVLLTRTPENLDARGAQCAARTSTSRARSPRPSKGSTACC